MRLTVIIPTHNPDGSRLRRTLNGLRAQTLPRDCWHAVLVNNASTRFPDEKFFADAAPANFSIVAEPSPGLTAARRRGILAATGELLVFVDDDNVLAPDYLAQVAAGFERHPKVGAAGGRSIGEFEREPAPWQQEFLGLLAVRDLGSAESYFSSASFDPRQGYPTIAPIGAGMALRKEAALAWIESLKRREHGLTDRRGDELTSSGDNDIVFTVIKAGWDIAYWPQLQLTHLIPRGRLDPGYLARLNRGIQKSWMQVLTHHDANPWPPIGRWTLRLRQAKAWLTFRAWSSAAAHIRWQGACGHFEGRAPAP